MGAGGIWMELLQLLYFQVVAQEEHITRAANALHVSQPALSKTIKRLEDELGVALFTRVGKTIRLNANGEIFLRYVTTALSALSDGKNTLTSLNSTSFPDITINLEAGADSLVKLIASFYSKYPQIRLFIRKANTKLTYPIAKYDLAIFMLSQEDHLPENSLILFEEDMVAAVPEGHPLCRKLYVDLIDLKNEKFVLFQESSTIRKMITHYCNKVGFSPNVVSECHDWHMLCDFVRAKVGISIIPKLSWQLSLQGIYTIPIRQPNLSRKMLITWFGDSHLNISSKLFIEYATRYYNELASGNK